MDELNMLPLQSLGAPTLNVGGINSSALQLKPMQTAAASGAAGINPLAMAGSFLGDTIQSFGDPNKPNYGTNIGGGALSGAAKGAAIGSIVPGIGTAIGAVAGGLLGGIKGLFGSKQREKQLEAQKEAELKAMNTAIGKQRLQEYAANNTTYNYAPTFRYGGMIPSYPNGGVIRDINPSSPLAIQAMYSGLKAPLDSALEARFPNIKEIRANAPRNFKERMAYADSVMKANPNIYIEDISEYLNPEQIELFKKARKSISDTQNANFSGTGPKSEAYGVRNYIFTPTPTSSRIQKETGRVLDKYGIGYNKDTGDFYKIPINNSSYKNGGSIKIKPSKRGTFKAQASKMGMSVQEAATKILNAPKGKYSPAMRKKANFAKNFAKANGGYLEETRYNPDVTTYASGGSTHETSPYGGIPIGNKGLVEDGEVRYKNYVFSNRF